MLASLCFRFQKCERSLRFLCEIELSLQFRAHFADLIFQKCSQCLSFWTFSSWNRALATVLCTFCRRLPRSSRAPAETETLLRRPRQPLYPKKHRVSRPRTFSNLNSRVPDLLHFPTTWWCGCHDDLVAMLVRKLAMTIVRNSEVS